MLVHNKQPSGYNYSSQSLMSLESSGRGMEVMLARWSYFIFFLFIFSIMIMKFYHICFENIMHDFSIIQFREN